jgi:hypothetical protein
MLRFRYLVADALAGSETPMSFGTPRQVHDEVHLQAEPLGREGELILSSAHSLEKDVPPANVNYPFAACRHHSPGLP